MSSVQDSAESLLLRETLVLRVREWELRAVEMATLPSEMAALAAQQVNEVRLSALEAPKEVGWGDIAFELILGFVINSSFAEKLAAKMFQRVYAKVLASQRVLENIPRIFLSANGRQLVRELQLARSLARKAGAGRFLPEGMVTPDMRRVPAYRESIESARAGRNLANIESAVKQQLEQHRSVAMLNKQDVRLYAMGVNEFVSESKNASAILKATKDAIKTGKSGRRELPPIATSDGSSVVVLEHFASLARAQRLHIRSLAARFEFLARTLPLEDDALALQFYDFLDAQQIFQVGDEGVVIESLMAETRLRLEALIWAHHLGFTNHPTRKPEILYNNSDNAFKGVHKRVEDYLFVRFRDLVIESKLRRSDAVSWDGATRANKAELLHQYFAGIIDLLLQSSKPQQAD